MNQASFRSVVQTLRARAAEQGDCIGYTFLVGGETIGDTLTYEQLDRRSREIAVMLSRVVKPGDRALLIYPPGLDFVAAFFGCLYAGIIAVPVYPPQAARPKRSLPQLRSIAAEAGISAVLCPELHCDTLHSLFQDSVELSGQPILSTDYYGLEDVDSWREPSIEADSIAFLQYTSGSTAAPKGVMVSHGNVVHNLGYIHQRAEHSDTVQVSWLPTYHDMGLFSGVLFPLFVGCPSYLMPPISFLQKPARWLQAISRFRGTHSGGPNFAYEMCAERITSDQRRELDLSCWRVAYNGAEPIRQDTLKQFAGAFNDCGFRSDALFPVYGLAESTVFVSGKPWSREHEHRPPMPHVSCGTPCYDTEVAIVDPSAMTRMTTGQIGEIWIDGPSVALGYWNRPEATRQTFEAYLADDECGPFLRTGDLGCVLDGELFVTGRIKDLVIVRGRKHYPQDIERTVELSHTAIRPQGSAAFAVLTSEGERLAIVAEVNMRRIDDGSGKNDRVLESTATVLQQIITTIREAISEHHELQTDSVSLLRRGSICKTSSGKIRRHAVRDALLSGTLETIACWRLQDEAMTCPTFIDPMAVYG